MNSDDQQVNILLDIVEGIGLNYKDDSIVLTATLNGNKIETEVIPSAISTPFNSHLMWETQKSSIKRMKTESLPIKIECFEANTRFGQEVRKLIGYILLPIRGLPILQRKKNSINKPHWYKLIGLNSEWKQHKPEISLHLSLTDKTSTDKLPSTTITETFVDSTETIDFDPIKTSEMLSSQKGLHIQLLQNEGLLQVGDKVSDCDIFIVKLMFKSATNVEQIVNPSEAMNSSFRIHYNLLGTALNCPLTPKGNGIFSIQEQIAIHFRTSLKSLRSYFNKVLYIPIALYYNETIVGTARFAFENLLEIHDLNDFINQYSENHTLTKEYKFPIETCFDLPPSVQTPFIEYIFTLKYLSTTKLSNCEIILDKPQQVEYIDHQAGGDKNECKKFELPPTQLESPTENSLNLRDVYSERNLNKNCQDEEFQEVLPKPKISKSAILIPGIEKQQSLEINEINEINTKMDMHSLLIKKCPLKTTKDVSRTFSLNLILQTVKFNRKPEIGIWQISLHHEKADTTYTIANAELLEISSNLIEFRNLELQLFFSSSPDQILQLIASEPCLLKINGPRGLTAFAEIDNENLLVNTKEKRSGIILMENQNGENVAISHIFVYLDDLGINLNSQIKRHNRETIGDNKTSYMNDELAYKIVEELEDWKEQQQDMFLVELKRKEVNFLGRLSAEWQAKKSEQENLLSTKLDECTKLSATLEAAKRTIDEKGLERIEKERIFERGRQEMESNYTLKMMESNEKWRRIEDDLTHKLKLQEIRYQELERTKESMQNENQFIKNELKKITEDFNEMKKSYLPKEQLSGLLQDVRILNERLGEVQKSKLFYKEQWAKIIREVHKMKSENLEKFETRLRNCHSINLQGILNAEQCEFYNERNELNDIKKKLNSDDDYEDSLETYLEI